MSNKVYSFTKVEKRRTKSGIYALAAGIISLAVLAFLIGLGIYRGGQMSGPVCLIPYITMIGSIVGAAISSRDRSRTDVAGKYLYSGCRICVVSAVLHGIVFLIGILKVIL